MTRAREIRRKWQRWVWCFFAINAVLMGSVIAFVLAVDPYQIYHRVLGGRQRFDLRIQRFYVPGMARTSDYGVALVGTSMLQNIPNSAVQRYCGERAVNLCMSGASIHEEAQAMALALKHRGTKTVIATLDYNSLSGGSLNQVVGITFPFPSYLYDDSPLDKFPYLLSWDSIVTSYRAVYEDASPEETENADWPWKFPPSMTFDAADAVRDIDPANINKKYGMMNLKLADMEKAFADNIFPLLEKDRNVRIHFVFPPYSILVWHDYAQRDQVRTYFAFKKWLVTQSERFGNFDVVDFQDRADIITNLSLYADIYHSAESIDEQMVQSACAGKGLLDRGNIEMRQAGLLQLIRVTDPAALVEKARGQSAGSSRGSVATP
ncbi:MAG TPA: hypothetical protein VHY84_28175 [Bryobacteraceae bacterium]|nr:hypothetical protein [Bryobacteraceae bacterium]